MFFRLYVFVLMGLGSLAMSSANALDKIDNYEMLRQEDEKFKKRRAEEQFNALDVQSIHSQEEYELYKKKVKNLSVVSGRIQTVRQDPLAVAVIFKDFLFMEYLLARGADPELKNSYSRNARELLEALESGTLVKEQLEYSAEDIECLKESLDQYSYH